jgi:HK97 family phage major capsid protein
MNEQSGFNAKRPYINKHDVENNGWLLAASAEFAKIGEKYTTPYGLSGTKSELLTVRANMRRALNKYRESIGDNQITNENLLTCEAAALTINAISAQLDLDEAAAAAFGAANRSDSGFVILDKTDKLSSLAPLRDTEHRVGFGEFVKAMAMGAKAPEIRAVMEEASIGGGGATVPEYLFAELIDRMRAKTVCINAGAVTVPLQTQKTSIARVTGDPTAGWRLENAAIVESAASFDRVTFTANSLAVLVKVSRELLEDSVNLNEALMTAFAGSMAISIDKAALIGSGTAPEPRGIWNTPGVNALPAAALNYSLLLDGVLALKAANANDPTALALAPGDWRVLQGLIDSTGQPLRPPIALEGVRQLATTTMPANQIILGDYSQLMIGVRSGLRIELLTERFADNHQFAFIAHLRADVQLAHPAAFVKIPTT